MQKYNLAKIKYIYSNKYNFINKKRTVKVYGRLIRKRIMGNASFLNIEDVSDTIQIYINKTSTNSYSELKDSLNLGDIITAEGCLFYTKTSELSLNANSINILSKNYNKFFDKVEGVSDKNIIYRKRYIALMSSSEERRKFIIRSKIINYIRNFFINRNYIEVETPILQNYIEGADAEPFETNYKYSKNKIFLRISPELHLKRLLIGGFEKIFEIGKNFRNEGLSIKHHPEFTNIEFYKTYTNYKYMMNITEDLINQLALILFNKTKIYVFGNKIDVERPFKKLKFFDALNIYAGIDKNNIKDIKYLKKILKDNNIDYKKSDNSIELIEKIFDGLVEKKLIQPTFITHHPIKISPLAKQSPMIKDCAERFELYINGMEIANGFSELNDPFEQERRFKEQNDKNYDTSFIEAMKYGMPPAAGEGIGLERLIMLLTNNYSIKDIILFPIMRSSDDK